MRYDKDNTRRIGGLLFDLLMLSFIFSFSVADVKITSGYERSALAFEKSTDNHPIISDLDSVFGNFQKEISKILPDYNNSLGAIFEFPQVEDAKIIVFTTSYLYKFMYTNTTINAP